MARNKYPEMTVSKILDVSVSVFLEKGYDHVIIQDIVDQMDGLTKGAIYHHFKGKEEILEALIDRVLVTDHIFERVNKDPTLTGLEKIKKVIEWSAMDKKHTDISKIALSVSDTPQFLRKQIHNAVDQYAPYIKRYIEQGNQDGSLHIRYPEQVAESFMLLFNIWLNPSVFPQSIEGIEEKIAYLRLLFQGIGLPAIDDALEKQLKRFFRKMLSP